MRLKRFILILFDLAAVNIVLLIAFLLRFEGRIPVEYLRDWWTMAAFVSVLRLAFFILFGLYRSLWRYSSLPELHQITKAVTLSSLCIFFLVYPIGLLRIPRSCLVMAWFLNIIFISGIRLAFRLRSELLFRSKRASEAKRILIVGAGSAGAMIAREMMRQAESGMTPIGFLDDSHEKQNRLLHDIPVVGRIDDVKNAVARYEPDEILIAIPSANISRMREILALTRETGLPVRILPGLLELADAQVSIGQIREVRVEDLLGREPVQTDLVSIAKYIRGERVLVTGAGGSIGSELCRQIAGFSPSVLLLLGRGENSIFEIDQELSFTYGLKLNKIPIIADMRDRVKIEQIFEEYRPTVVFHAAAHKHVPLMEATPAEAVKNNVFGTKNVAEMADKYGVKRFVLISTDKAVNPTSVMGATKRVAEMVVQHLAKTSGTKFCAVRFGNVLGSRGSVVPLFQKQIARGGPVTVTDPEMRRYFMTIPEAVSLVIQAGAMVKGGEIFILDMGEPVKIHDLALALIRFSGFEPNKDIEIKFSGIRPGEKLYEELLTAEEGTTHTRHERILVANPNGVDWQRLPRHLVELERWAFQVNQAKVVEKLRSFVPRYSPVGPWSEVTELSDDQAAQNN